MTQAKTIIAFDEGRLPPAGTYAFELDLTGENGCAMVETLVWLIDSLKSPFEVWQAWAADLEGVAVDCGHFVCEERPDDTAAALLDFFKG